MTIYYKDGFYISDIHENIPESAVEISEELYIDLLEGQSEGKQIVSDEHGNPRLAEPAPSSYHYWNGQHWAIDNEQQQAMLYDIKKHLLAELAAKTDKLKAQILAGYSQAEIESFYRQEREAREWQANNQAATPMLSQIADSRPEIPSLAVLVEKVIEKADAFSAVMGGIIGKKQAIETRIELAKNSEELTACEQEINEWQLANH